MNCVKCQKPGKRFTMLPSRKRMEFMEHYCPKCAKLEIYDRAKLEQAKKTAALPCQ